MEDNRNVKDKYRGWEEDLIREDLKKQMFPFAVLMEHLQGDFNIGTIVRNANAFGAEKVLYTGKKKWDRRGAVGTHNYTYVDYVEDVEPFKEEFTFVALENNNNAVPMFDFEWPEHTLMIVGEEGSGISDDLLKLCDHVVAIPQFGSVRSLNAATAAGIAMYDLVRKYSTPEPTRLEDDWILKVQRWD